MLRRDLLSALGLTRRRETGRAVAQGLSDLRRRMDASDTRAAELAQEIADLRGWLHQTSDRSDEVAGRLEAAIDDRATDQTRIERLVASDDRLDHSGGLELET